MSRLSPLEKHHKLVLATVLILLIICVGCAGFLYREPRGWAIAGLVVLLGFAVGAVIGAITSPAPGETNFPDYTKAISAFVSGVLLTKLGDLIDQVIDGQPKANSRYLVHSAVFLIGLVGGTFVVYMLRTYVFPVRDVRAAPGTSSSAKNVTGPVADRFL